MGVYLSKLSELRLGGRGLVAFGSLEAARATWASEGGPAALASEEVAGQEAPPLPPPGAGAAAALQMIHVHHGALTPDVETLIAFWRAAAADPGAEAPQGEDLEALTEITEWASWELEYARHPAPLVIATALAELLTRAPFPSGNIRLARLWCVLMLLRARYGYARRVGVEEALEPSKGPLKALRQRLLDRPGLESLELWVEALLEVLDRHATLCLADFREGAARAPLPRLQEQLLRLARSEGRLTSRRARMVTGVSRNTLKDNFRRLVELGHLDRHGQRRGVFYTVAKPRAGDDPEG